MHLFAKAMVEKGLAKVNELNHNMNELDWHDEFLFSWADVVITQRVYESEQIQLLKQYRDKFKFLWVYEIDDDLEGIEHSNPAFYYFKGREQKEVLPNFRLAVSLCDLVSVSTQPLKDKLLKYNPNIEIFYNSLDFTLFQEVNIPKEDGRIRIIYWGGNNHYLDFCQIAPVIRDVMSANDLVDFVLFGYMPTIDDYRRTMAYGYKQADTKFDFEEFYEDYGNRITYKKWVPIQNYQNVLPSFGADIAVAPLIDNSFNTARSNLKCLEASAIGLPLVADKMYPYEHCTDDEGTIPLLAKNYSQWKKNLEILIADEDARRMRAARAFSWVHENFDLHSTVGSWITLYRENLEKVRA